MLLTFGLLAPGVAALISNSVSFSGNASISERFLQDFDDFDESDLSHIRKIAAIGDSYSAGIGAGDRLGGLQNWYCSRYDHSYPYLLNQHPQLGSPDQRKFQFLSCSGAVVQDVVDKQLPAVEDNQQVILLSAGGNDAELTAILNLCVFQWAAVDQSFVSKVKAVAEALMDKFEGALASKSISWITKSVSRTCEAQMERSAGLIGSNDFDRKLDDLISRSLRKLGPNGMLYYTGYAKFFATSMSPGCDKVTWKIWTHFMTNMFQTAQYLTRQRRETMNRLVDQMNKAISSAVARAGSQAQFVDYDHYVGQLGGRFCEDGVDEASRASNVRPGLMFYELEWTDPAGKTTWRRDSPPPPPSSFEGTVNALALITAELNKDSKLVGLEAPMRMVDVLMDESSAQEKANIVSAAMPQGWMRVFHPQILLHKLIASLIIFRMTAKNTIDHGFAALPEQARIDSCPIKPKTQQPLGIQQAPRPQSPKQPQPVSQTYGAGTGHPLQIALASYTNPTVDPGAWTIMRNMKKVSILVANVLNGPDSKVNDAWATVISDAHDSGKLVLGYVRTGYLGKSQQKYQTMLGSTDLADWMAQIQTDVELWYSLYKEKISGIFFDEGWNHCSDPGQNDNLNAEVYRMISENTKRRHPGAYTVLNPGDYMPQCFEHSADTLLTYESNFTNYKDETLNIWRPLDWDHTPDPQKIWHIIHSVPPNEVQWTVDKARERGAGFVEVTDKLMPNPYDRLPDENYRNALERKVEGGKPTAAPYDRPLIRSTHAFGYDIQLRAGKVDYSSAELQFTLSGDPAFIAIEQVGFGERLRVLGSMRRVTVGNLTHGKNSYRFQAHAIGPDGRVGARSNIITVTTMELPGGRPITNISVRQSADMTIYEADVLLAYAFVRIHITDPGYECNTPSLRTALDKDINAVCSHYMIEGSTSYKYNASAPSPQGDWPWQWYETSKKDNDGNNMVVTRHGYRYRWELPISATNKINTSNIIVQGEGFSPRVDVFRPCPCLWKSKTDVITDNDQQRKYCADDAGWCPYECGGNLLGAGFSARYCDCANNLATDRNHKTYRPSRVMVEAGSCFGNAHGMGCAVQIMGTRSDGKPCEISGDELWYAYQNITHKQIGGCDHYGKKHFRNGCYVSIDFYTGCDERDKSAYGLTRFTKDVDFYGDGLSCKH